LKLLTNEIQSKKLFLLDIDGTISLDSTLIDGTMDFVHYVNDIHGKYIFITNNSTKSIEDYVIKFTKMGIPVEESNFLTASYVTALYLKEKYQNQMIFALGTKSFQKELKNFGLNITDIIKPDIVAAVVGFDNELDYDKITKICELLQTREVDYIATNPDKACPVGFGFVPDCGAICDLLEHAVKKQPFFVGKPNRTMVDLAIKATGFTREETLVIGDRLYTDIACGINGEVDTILVFTGEAKQEDLEDTQFQPTYYCNSMKDIYENLVTK
jgi:Predicted sugar phosphatases of the HAD superfamily